MSSTAYPPLSVAYPLSVRGFFDQPSRALWLVKWLLLCHGDSNERLHKVSYFVNHIPLLQKPMEAFMASAWSPWQLGRTAGP
jgi:hypothetical protein